MSVTADTSHFDRCWLKEEASENILPIFVTADTSHFERSWLKAEAAKNMALMLVTADTSQSPIGVASQSPIGSCEFPEQSPIGDAVIQSWTASRSFFESGLNAAVVRVKKWR